ncbi:MAG: hypothetical protein QM530_08520 [Phycisphaerales bacterium]|nr:hypothetical protein [Phycisphaerales bacterium]
MEESWWQNDYTSIIVYPDAIIESEHLPQKQAYELAAEWAALLPN